MEFMSTELVATFSEAGDKIDDEPIFRQASREKQRIVVVLGMHRSGTSLLANLLSVLGVDLGEDLLPGDPGNELGYWENENIYRIQDALMNHVAREWGDCGLAYPFAIDWTRLPELQNYKEKLVSIVRTEIAAAKGIWGFKDPRTCRLLPLWKEIFEELELEPLYVLAVRDPAVVADSLVKRDGLDPLHSELIWLLHNLEAIRDAGNELRIVVDYDRWFTAPREQAIAVAKALDLSWPEDDVELIGKLTGAIRPDLRHSKAMRPCCLPFVAHTYETLKRAAMTGTAPDNVVRTELRRSSECLAAALELSAGTGKIAIAVGDAEMAAGNPEGAVAAYTRATRLQPRFAATHASLSSALLSLGRWKEAYDSAKKALSLDATDAAALKVMARIENNPEHTFNCVEQIEQTRIARGTADQLAVWEVTVGTSSFKSIFLQPPAEIIFDVPTGATGWLTTAVMLHPDVWDKPESVACEFHIRVDGRLAFVMSLDPVKLPSDRRWHEIRLHIPETARDRHQIHFETRPVGKSDFRWALWREPRFTWEAHTPATPAALSPQAIQNAQTPSL
jgi:hypothetical protein